MTKRILLIAALYCGVGMAQIQGTLSVASGAMVWCTSGGGCSTQWAGGGGSWIEQETRKDDGKGPTLQQVKDSRVSIQSKDLAPVGYAKLAKSLGVKESADEADMLKLIHEHGLHVYDWAKVDDYLYRKALRQKSYTRWVWEPLRESDVKTIEASTGMISHVGYIYPKQYAQKVPARVLENVSCMLADMKEAVFLISDYEVIKPDPFLAITTPELLRAGKIWVIDRWDEPGFVDKPEPVKPVSTSPIAKKLPDAKGLQIAASMDVPLLFATALGFKFLQ